MSCNASRLIPASCITNPAQVCISSMVLWKSSPDPL